MPSSWALSSFSRFNFVVLGKNSCPPHYWFRISAVITKSTPRTAVKLCLTACPHSNPHPFSLVRPRTTKTRHPTIPCHRIRPFLQVCGILSFDALTHNFQGNASWDIADGIAHLGIASGFDTAENIHGPIRTPPKTKKATEPVVQLHDTSPLVSSDTSLDSKSSPPASDERLALANHSRVSSADTTASTQLSGSSHTLASSALGLKVNPEQRDRPHSYSGGLSTADLQRLRGVGTSPPDGEGAPQWSTAVDRQSQYDQPLYPSLSSYPRQSASVTEDLQVDYNTQQRQFQPLDGSIPSPQAFNSRTTGSLNGTATYRSQPARGYNPGLVSNATYSGPSGHTAHLSLGNTQQMYDMMMPSHENPAVARVQQQHSVFRATHQHSSSDPLHLREAAALLSGFQPGLYPPPLGPPLPLYPNQFFPPSEAYPSAGVAAQVMAAARLQSQFHTPYGVNLPGQSISPGLGDGSQGSPQNVDPSGNGPSANNRKLGLYKTELCRSWEEKGTCRYGPKCQFAHGEDEIRKVSRHPKVVPSSLPLFQGPVLISYLMQYKTEICRVSDVISYSISTADDFPF